MKENSSNILAKSCIFILAIALTCVIFFGFMEGAKTEVDYTAFGLILFAELILYIAVIVSSKKKAGKLNSSDVASLGIIYFITNFITNCLCLKTIGTLKMLLLINAVEIIVFLILICIVLLRKKEN